MENELQSNLLKIGLHLLVGIFAGLVKAVMKVEQKGAKVVTFLSNALISSFISVALGFLCLSRGFDIYFSLFLSAMAGIAGKSILEAIQKEAPKGAKLLIQKWLASVLAAISVSLEKEEKKEE